MRKTFITSLFVLLVLGLLIIAVAWYLVNDESFLKKTLHDLVLKRTGRELTVDGPLTLDLGKTTTLDVRQLSFSGAEWDPGPYMASAGQVHLSVDFMSLFGEQLVVHQLALSDCSFDFRKNSSGQSNWDVFGNTDVEPALPTNAPVAPPVRLEHLTIDTCHFSHDTPAREEPIDLTLASVALNLMEEGGYEGQITGSVEEYPLSFKGQFGPVRSLWEGGLFSFQMDLQAGSIALKGSGSLADARSISGANIDMQFSGPEFAEVTNLLALPPFSTDAFDFSLKLHSNANLTSIDLDGDLGSFDISADGELDRLVEPGAGHVDLSASGPNLEALGELLHYPGLVPDAFTLKLKAAVDQGITTLDPLELETPHDALHLSGAVGAWPELRNSSVQFTARTDDIGRWQKLLDRPGLKGSAFSVSGNLRSDAAGLISLQADTEVLESHLHLDGAVGTRPGPYYPDMDFAFVTPHLDRLSTILKIKDLPAAAAKANGHLTWMDSGFKLKNTSIQLASTNAVIDGYLVPEARFAGSDFTLQIDTPSLAWLGRQWGWENLPDLPLVMKGGVTPLGKGLAFQSGDARLGGIQLSFQGRMADVYSPREFKADVNVQMDSLKRLAFLSADTHWLDLPLTASGGVQFEHDSVRLGNVHLVLGQSIADVDGVVTFADDRTGSTLDIRGSGKDLRELFPDWKLASLPRTFSIAGSWTRVAQSASFKDVRLQWGEAVLELSGSADHFWPPGKMDLAVELSVPDGSVYNKAFNWDLQARPVSATAHLFGTQEKFTLESLSTKLGDSQSVSQLQVEWGSPPRVSGTLDADIIDLSYWMGPRGEPEVGSAAKPKMVFGDQPVRAMGNKLVELDLQITSDKANFGNGVIEGLKAGLNYTDTEFRLDHVEAHDRTGQKIAGSFLLDTSGTIPRVEMVAHGSGLRLGIASAKGQDPSTFAPTELDLDLKGSGATRHELASSLSGTLRLFQGTGKVAASGIKILFGDFFSQLFDLLNPFSKADQYDELDCSVFAADVLSGIASFDPIVVQLKEVTILSKGTIDLKTEHINLSFNTIPRKGIGLTAGILINPFIKVGGTLAAPAMELDPAKAVIKGGAMVATAGIPMLAKTFTDRISGRDPCVEARKKLEKAEAPGP